MFLQREKVKFFESTNQWPTPLKLSTAVIHILGIGQRDELLIQEDLGNLNNSYKKLLLPHELSETYREKIGFSKRKESIVIYDAEGRVHQLVLRNSLFIIMSDLWKITRHLKKINTGILKFDKDTCTLDTVFREGQRFTLPRDALDNLVEWKPIGNYDIEYDDEWRVFNIFQPASEIEGKPETKIPVGYFWDRRFLFDPFSLIIVPRQRKNREIHIEDNDEKAVVEEEEAEEIMVVI